MENSVTERLQALKKLQEIDSLLANIEKTKGALPEEARDLEDDIAGLVTRQEKIVEEANAMEQEIATNKTLTKEAEVKIKTYEEQQENVRNNREFEAIAKEIEYQHLEIQHLEQKNKRNYPLIEEINVSKLQAEELLAEKEKLVQEKKEELHALESESLLQEQALEKKRKRACKAIEDRLLRSYDKIRLSARNGLAVVSIRKGACGGCFNVVPPQKQADVREQKKILVCEHCGRIFCDVLQIVPAKVEKKKITRRKTTTAAAKKTTAAAKKTTAVAKKTTATAKTATAKKTAAATKAKKSVPKPQGNTP